MVAPFTHARCETESSGLSTHRRGRRLLVPLGGGRPRRARLPAGRVRLPTGGGAHRGRRVLQSLNSVIVRSELPKGL